MKKTRQKTHMSASSPKVDPKVAATAHVDPHTLPVNVAKIVRVDRRDEGGGSTLVAYFNDLGREALMSPAEEIKLSRSVVEAEVNHWAEVLSHPPTRLPILHALEQRLKRAAEESDAGDAEDAGSAGAPNPVQRKTGRLPLATVRKMIRHPDRVPELVTGMAEAIRLADVDREWIAEARRVLAAEVLGDGDESSVASMASKSKAISRAMSKSERAYLARVEASRRVVVDLKSRFVRANLRYAVSLAKRYARGKLPLPDLIQEANIGLMRAVDRFDPDRGYRFTTYASWWIRHALTRSIADTSRAVRLPVHIQEVALKVNRLVSVFVAMFGREPTVDELVAESGLSREKVTRMLAIGTGSTMSLDRPIGEDPDGSTFVDMLTDESVRSAHDRVESQEIQKRVADAVAKLPERFAYVLRLRFGIGTDDDQTLHQIGDKLGVSRERIRQIEAQALRILRDMLREKETPKDKERRLRVLRRLQLPRDVAPITTSSTLGAHAEVAEAHVDVHADVHVDVHLAALRGAPVPGRPVTRPVTRPARRRRAPLATAPSAPQSAARAVPEPDTETCTCWMAQQGHRHRQANCPVARNMRAIG